MTKGQRSSPKMADMNNGQACGACHDGKTAFSVKEQADCAKCHKKA
jgi:c(7)-type cytochrome triheme protein